MIMDNVATKENESTVYTPRKGEDTIMTPTKEEERKFKFDTDRKVDFEDEIDVLGPSLIKLKKMSMKKHGALSAVRTANNSNV